MLLSTLIDSLPEIIYAVDTNNRVKVVNKALLEDFLNSLPPTPLDRMAIMGRLTLFGTAHFREVAPADDFIQQLNAIDPVTLADLRKPADTPAPVPAASSTCRSRVTPGRCSRLRP